MIDPLDYLNLVYAIARDVCPNHHGDAWDEVVADGMVGLVQACNRFDPTKSPQFIPWARTRIRGAMIDGLRRRYGDTRHGRRPRPGTVPIDAVMRGCDELALADILPASDDPAEETCAATVIDMLPARDRYIVLRTVEGATAAELGTELGVTASRVSQLRIRIRRRVEASA